jgi:hypothetical protein
MNSTLTYHTKATEDFDPDHPFEPVFGIFRRWLGKHGFSGISEFVGNILLEVLFDL